MENMLQTNLAETVRVLRTLRGLTQTELAERSSLSSVYVRQIERGERDVGLTTLNLLAKGLECKPGDLLPRSQPSAADTFVVTAYTNAPREVQQAILYLIGPPRDASLRKAILALISGEVMRPPRTADRPPKAVGAAEGTPKATKRPRKR